MNPVEDAAEEESPRHNPVRSMLLLDLLRDRDSRLVFLWALASYWRSLIGFGSFERHA
jgi:hypothetical protein